MLKNIKPDKWKHFFAGIAMGAFLQVLMVWLLPGSITMATLIVFVIVVAISYGFELFSKFSGWGHYDIQDAIASIIGGLFGMGLGFVVYQVTFILLISSTSDFSSSYPV